MLTNNHLALSTATDRPWRRLAALVGLLLIVTALSGPPPAIQAAPGEIAVNTLADEYGTGAGCSLREAIEAANSDAAFGGCSAGSGADTITLPAGAYALTRAGHSEDGNSTGDLDIHGSLTITGAGSSTTTIDGGGLDRVLQVRSGTVALKQLTITGGQAPHGADGADGASPGADGQNGSAGQHGGGIYNGANLELENAIVRDNKAGNGGQGGDGSAGADGGGDGLAGQNGGRGGQGAPGGNGGGIYSADGARVDLSESTLLNNQAGDGGTGGNGSDGGAGGVNAEGGFAADGHWGGWGGHGGGLYNGDDGRLTVSDSIIRANRAGNAGDGGSGGTGGSGGGQVGTGRPGAKGGTGSWGGRGGGFSSHGPTTVLDSTIHGNRSGDGSNAGQGGDGGLHSADGGIGNYAGEGGDGGGILYGHDSTLSVFGSTISGNETGAGGDSGDGGDGSVGRFDSTGGKGGSVELGEPGGCGGGIWAANLLLADSIVRENRTGSGGKAGDGGDGGNGGLALDSGGGDGGDAGYSSRGGTGGSGGGICGKELVIVNSQIVLNSTGEGGQPGIGGKGGDGGRSFYTGRNGGSGGKGGRGGFGGDGGEGGGIDRHSVTNLSITETTIRDNATGSGADGGPGGQGGAGGLAPVGSFHGSNGDGGRGGHGGAGGNGGGLALFSSLQGELLEASTVSGNRTGDGGKGGDGGPAGLNTGNGTGNGGMGGNGGEGGSGGGLIGYVYLDLVNMTVSGNRTGRGGDGGSGGSGLANVGAGGDGGDAGQGGGISNFGYGPSATVTASTIAHNQALGQGGDGGSGVPAGQPGSGGLGGGVYNKGTDELPLFEFGHTIISGNQASAYGHDCFGNAVTSLDHNLISHTNDCIFFGYIGMSVLNTDADLAPLGDNGGATWTHLPLPGSPVLDKGLATCRYDNGAILPQDQRGRTRPQDIDGDGSKLCDIGAVEVQGYHSVDVILEGEGQGSVASAPSGIDCGGDCTQAYDLATKVVLTATAGAGWGFDGWSGDCSGWVTVCEVNVDGDKSVTARFGPPVSRVFLPVVLRGR